MKLPKTFVPEKDLEEKTEELLALKNPTKLNAEFTDYKQIWYSTEGTSWVIEYEKHDPNKVWVLYDKDFYEQRWYENSNLDDRAEAILKNRMKPLIELLGLKENQYSVKKDNFRSILEKHANKISEEKFIIEDKDYGECDLTIYKKGNMLIELKEFKRVYLGRILDKK